MRATRLALGLTSLASVIQANDRVDGKTFLDDPFNIVVAGAPMWHFGRPSGDNPCYPSPAVNPDGTQAKSSPADLGFTPDLSYGCGDPGPWQGRNTPGEQFPTYYTINYCDGPTPSWRDSYHENDWEWASTVWQKDPGDEDKWYRASLLLSYHQKQTNIAWNKVQNTVKGLEDLMDQGKSDLNHAKVYVGVFKHAMFGTRYTALDTIGTPGMEFRSNDWYYLPLWPEDLVDGSEMPDFKYGDAKSSPRAVSEQQKGVGFDICTV